MPSNSPGLMEAIVRQLVAMRHPPVVLFVTVHLWCMFGPTMSKRVVSYGRHGLPDRTYNFFDHIDDLNYSITLSLTNETKRIDTTGRLLSSTPKFGPIPKRNGIYTSPSDAFTDGVTRICNLYPVDCISQRDALRPGFRAGRPGFAVQEIAGDCLHPFYGTRGAEYMTDLLVHWAMTGYERWAMMRRQHVPANDVLLPEGLPRPANPKEVSEYESKRAACYHLAPTAGGSSHADAAALPWRTVTCWPAEDVSPPPRTNAASLDPSGCHSDNDAKSRKCPSTYHLPRVLGSADAPPLPPVWTYCPMSTVGNAGGASKPSPGVAAFVPGATLIVPLPTDWLQKRSGSAATSTFNVTLQHLVSWNSMGSVRVACTGACTCTDHVVDAHAETQAGKQKVTVFTEHTFEAALHYRDAMHPAGESDKECGLVLQVTNASSSGGYMFKVRDILLFLAANPCKVGAVARHFLAVRSHLECAEPAGG